MKKHLALGLILILLLCAAACSNNTDIENNTTDSQATEPDTTELTENISLYDENTALFVCQDRSDIEGDRDTIYYYNYKGDLLNSTDSMQIGFYAKNGLAPAYDPITGLIGFVDRNGIFVIEPQWNDAAAFSDDGIALVVAEVENEEGRFEDKYGFINDKGEQITPCIYDEATSFYPCGLAIIGVEKEKEYAYPDGEGGVQMHVGTYTLLGVIDKSGKVLIEPQFKHIEHIADDYIVCVAEDGYKIYDLSGNVLDECESYIDETSSYYYTVDNGKLYRYVRTLEVAGQETSENASDGYTYSEPCVFNGKEFDYNYSDYDGAYIRFEHVATTSSGLGYGVWEPGENRDEGEVVIPYEYDQIRRYGSYYVCIKYQNGDMADQLLDIYNNRFEKTAENLDYNFDEYRTEAFGDEIILPDGYFQVSCYDAEVGETIRGIINSTGEFVVPLLYYRTIYLFTYEGAGGKFVY